MMSQNKHTNSKNLLLSHLAIRKCIGFLGLTIGLILAIGHIILEGQLIFEDSISSYYHTRMRDVFVAIIGLIAAFLITYRGYEKDRFVMRIAGVAALGVAFFPTSYNDLGKSTENLHFISALIFFATLIYMAFFLFTKGDADPSDEKRIRNKIYRTCAVVMAICIIAIGIYFKYYDHEPYATIKPVFWLETLALMAFGFSWIVKGEALFSDE